MRYITLKAYKFPYINVLWLGTIVMVIGFLMSMFYRSAERLFLWFLEYFPCINNLIYNRSVKEFTFYAIRSGSKMRYFHCPIGKYRHLWLICIINECHSPISSVFYWFCFCS